MILGGDATHIGCIHVWPEGAGAGDFQGSGGDECSSTTNNRAAEDVVQQKGMYW